MCVCKICEKNLNTFWPNLKFPHLRIEPSFYSILSIRNTFTPPDRCPWTSFPFAKLRFLTLNFTFDFSLVIYILIPVFCVCFLKNCGVSTFCSFFRFSFKIPLKGYFLEFFNMFLNAIFEEASSKFLCQTLHFQTFSKLFKVFESHPTMSIHDG